MASENTRWRTLTRALLFIGSCAFLLALSGSLPGAQSGSSSLLLIGPITSLGCFALTVLLCRWDGLLLSDVGSFPNRKSPILLAMGMAFGFLLITLHSFLVGVVGRVDWVRISNPSTREVGVQFIGYLLLASREELAFHGYPLRRLQSSFGVWIALTLIAILFALEHIAGGWPFSQALWGAAMGSFLFGMASIATRGLAVPIGIHAAWNIGDWMRGNRAQPGLWRPEIQAGSENQSSWAGLFCYVTLMVMATLCFWWWHRRREDINARVA